MFKSSIKYLAIGLLTLCLSKSFSKDHTKKFSCQDSLKVLRIDSLLDLIKEKRSGLKLRSQEGTENYHFNTDNKLFLVAVYTDNSSLFYFFIEGELVKVIYGEKGYRYKKHKNIYYFSSGQLIYKLEDSKLETQDFNILLQKASLYKAKVKDF